ncbi:hypothetical protein BH09BAC6_BH09BAC6_25360 [soil metagenome]
MKKHLSKSIILVLLGSLVFSSCALEYRDTQRQGHYRRYHDRDDRRHGDDDHNNGYDNHYHDHTH